MCQFEGCFNSFRPARNEGTNIEITRGPFGKKVCQLLHRIIGEKGRVGKSKLANLVLDLFDDLGVSMANVGHQGTAGPIEILFTL